MVGLAKRETAPVDMTIEVATRKVMHSQYAAVTGD
jgi:hypothetical protein